MWLLTEDMEVKLNAPILYGFLSLVLTEHMEVELNALVLVRVPVIGLPSEIHVASTAGYRARVL